MSHHQHNDDNENGSPPVDVRREGAHVDRENPGAERLPHPLVQPTLPVEDAGRWLGLKRSAAYDRAREWERTGGESGLPVIRMGGRLLVPTAALWRLLGLDPGVAL